MCQILFILNSKIKNYLHTFITYTFHCIIQTVRVLVVVLSYFIVILN